MLKQAGKPGITLPCKSNCIRLVYLTPGGISLSTYTWLSFPFSSGSPIPPPKKATPTPIFIVVCSKRCSTGRNAGLGCSALAPRITPVSEAHPGAGKVLCGQEAESRQRQQPAAFKNQEKNEKTDKVEELTGNSDHHKSVLQPDILRNVPTARPSSPGRCQAGRKRERGPQESPKMSHPG